MTVTEEMLLDAIASSSWEQGQARAELSAVPEVELVAEVSAAIDLLVEDAFDDVPAPATIRVATDCTWTLEGKL